MMLWEVTEGSDDALYRRCASANGQLLAQSVTKQSVGYHDTGLTASAHLCPSANLRETPSPINIACMVSILTSS